LKKNSSLANEQIPKELEELLTSDEGLDDCKSRVGTSERAGIDPDASLKRLKLKLEKKVQEMENQGREVPSTLLKIIEIL
jgi:hypothetical protein